MKNKVIAIFLALAIVSGQPLIVMAEPNKENVVEETRNDLEDIEAYLGKIEDKLRALDEEILTAQQNIDKNEEEIRTLKNEIDEAKEKTEALKIEIAKKEELLGRRIRTIYKSNRFSEYISIFLNCSGFSDFITKIKAVNIIIENEQELIQELTESREYLNELQRKLEEKSNEIQLLKKENEEKLVLLMDKKDEQNQLLEKAKEERSKVKVDLREQEEALVAFPIGVINNSASSDREIEESIATINRLRSSIVTDSVDKKIEQARAKGEKILKERKEERKKQEEERKKQEEEKKKQEQENNKPDNSGNTGGTGNNGGSGSNNNSNPGGSGGGSNSPEEGSVTGVDIVNYAYKFLGVKYVWGGTTPDGFDCSGLTQYVYRHFGYRTGRTTSDQIYAGIAVSQGSLKAGDLVFTSSGHVGIYVGDNRMIHAPQTGDVVKVSKIWSFYAARRLIY